MDRIEKSKSEYKKKLKNIRLALFVEIIMTACISVSVIWTGFYTIQDTATQSTQELGKEYETLIEGYKKAFSSMLIPIRDKFAEDPSFEEMSDWMLSKEVEFKEAFGGDDVYDGIALTYKGGFAHSWNYGDYTDYDPNTRPWYQQAQEADGEVTVVAPYVTYLDPSYLSDDGYILMTIAQKYNDEISFDLDLKIKEIQNLLHEKKMTYEGEQIFLFNQQGYILTSTDEKVFAHNIYQEDDVISADLSTVLADAQNKPEKLVLESIDGKRYFFFIHEDIYQNQICVQIPFREVFVHDFLNIIMITCFMILFEIFMFYKNKRNCKEYMWRDMRLCRVADATYEERLYVDLKKMQFSGNEMASRNSRGNSYQDLFALLKSRLTDENEIPQLEAFLGQKVVENWTEETFTVLSKRFSMRMQEKESGEFKNKTIEVGKMKFQCDGKPMMCISMRDATESVDLLKKALKEAEQLKQEKEEEYNRFMGYICTAQDGVEELNVKEHTITRYTMKDDILQKITIPYPSIPFDLFHEDDRDRARELYSEEKLSVMCENTLVSYAECRMKWNDAANYRWCNVIVLGIPISEKNPFNVLVLIKDVNELKEKEEQQKKALEDAFKLAEQGSQAKGSFLSKMSHEIRTPLNAIIGYLSIAKDSEGDLEKINHCIDNSQIASKHLLQIINDVLDMSSIESGKMKIANEEFDLKKEISDITTIFYQNAKIKGIRFETHIDALVEEWVVGDQLRLNQILMNLLSNAVKFTPENGVITFQITQLNPETDENEAYLQFEVSDTGIGMSEEYLSRLFQPFEQESAVTAKKYGGSGLGLSITNNLIHMMGGTIKVKSKQNVGTTFTVTMHFEKSKQHTPQKLRSEDYSHVRVLVVDDQENECSFVKSMLKRCGVKADSVTSGTDALKRLRGRAGSDYEYDLCILDWSMPEMNGIEVAGRIREEFGEQIPIIIATAYDVSEFEEEAREAGVNKVIAKPLFQSTLFDILVSTFGKYDPEAAKSPTKEKINMEGIRVLLAEDNAMNMDIAVTVLEKAGVEVKQAVNGKIAYDIFTTSKPGTYDMILMDVQMPVMDGYEATKRIRESDHPEATSIPIVAMTANAFAEDVAEALSKGMNAHIAKPVNYDKLFELLQKFTKPKVNI